MLPGMIAGYYTREEAHIDLRRLARFANVRMIHAEACGVKEGYASLHEFFSILFELMQDVNLL